MNDHINMGTLNQPNGIKHPQATFLSAGRFTEISTVATPLQGNIMELL